MSNWSNMPAVGIAVCVIIALMFVLSVILLFYVFIRYKHLTGRVADRDDCAFTRSICTEFAAAYKNHGDDTNTPAIIDSTVAAKLPGLLFCERFLNNAVSLFVTLGLFGTFMGLSLSVSSLTELISYSNTDQWLSVLNSVGEGLMSALSGMGVAFYTSLVGVACSIILTILRSIFSPAAARENLVTQLELWLDHEVAPKLPTDAVKDDATLIKNMISALDRASEAMASALGSATDDIKRSLLAEKELIDSFDKSIDRFNEGVRDFGEVDYNLRGSVERLDVAVRDFTGLLRRGSRSAERNDEQ